ncbi:hypothetical protein QQ045_005790 [Rhodiola kirilowii]
MAMANNKQADANSWITEGAPVMVVMIIAVHVIGLVYWMYRLATQKPAPRKKMH